MGIRLGGGSGTAPPTTTETVTFYTEANFGGTYKKFAHGAYDCPGPPSPMLWDYRLRSVKIPPGFTVTLYPSARFQGEAKVFTSDTPDIGEGYRDDSCSFTVKEP